MKKTLLLFAFIFFVAATAMAQSVGTDRVLHSNIKAYKTYTWSQSIDQIPSDQIFVGPNGVLVFNNESTRNKIKEAIQYELSAKGYKLVNSNPDFVVNFVVLEQPAELVTYNGYTLLNGGLDTVRTEDNVDKAHVSSGTVLINFVDFKTSRQVWQGYASGVLNPTMINSATDVRSAISSIFDKYPFDAIKNND